ncbi:phospholipase D-like domain-containing protein [Serratia ureilytica]|uniref:phospholipase D-like domain-containing protein n=1 Tax=Serratia ureilytica TaxID=300181 RepID=UPI003D73B11D
MVALVAAKRRGVNFRIVVEAEANAKYTVATYLTNKGISVRAMANTPSCTISRCWSMIILCSYNYPTAADRDNAENVLVIHNHPNLVAVYQKEFERLWQESQPLIPGY